MNTTDLPYASGSIAIDGTNILGTDLSHSSWATIAWKNTSNKILSLLSMRGIKMSNGGIFIDTSILSSQKEILGCLQEIYASGGYIENIDLRAITRLLQAKPEEYPTLNTPIGKSILPFPPQFIPFERRIRINPAHGSVTFEFWPLYFQLDEQWEPLNETENRPAKFNEEIFIALLMRKGIFSGFQLEKIRELIETWQEKTRIELIAENIEPIDGLKAEEASSAILKQDLRRKEIPSSNWWEKNGSNTARVNLREAEVLFPRAAPGDMLVRKKRATPWINGVTTMGKLIPAKNGTDIDLALKMGNGTQIFPDDEANEDILKSTVSGYINISRTWMISVDSYKKNSKPIGLANEVSEGTGSSVLVPDGVIFIQQSDVKSGYYLKWQLIEFTLETDKQGKELKDRRISVQGSVEKTGVGDLDIPGGINMGWSVTVTRGNLTVQDGIRQAKRILVLQGKVKAPFLENTIVVADEVEVDGHISNSTIIARKVSARSSIGSKISALDVKISTKSDGSTSGEESVIMPIIYSTRKLETEIQDLNNAIQTLETEIQMLETEIQMLEATKTKFEKDDRDRLMKSDLGKRLLELISKNKTTPLIWPELKEYETLRWNVQTYAKKAQEYSNNKYIPPITTKNAVLTQKKNNLAAARQVSSKKTAELDIIRKNNDPIRIDIGGGSNTNRVVVAWYQTNLIPSFRTFSSMDTAELEKMIKVIQEALDHPNDNESVTRINLQNRSLRPFTVEDFLSSPVINSTGKRNIQDDSIELLIISAKEADALFATKQPIISDGNRHRIPVTISSAGESFEWLLIKLGLSSCWLGISKHTVPTSPYEMWSGIRIKLNSKVYICKVIKVVNAPNSHMIQCEFVFQGEEARTIYTLKNDIQVRQATNVEREAKNRWL